MSSYMARAAALLGVADPTTNGNGSVKLQFVEDALRRPRGIDPLTNKAYPKIDAYECALAIAPALAGRLGMAGRPRLVRSRRGRALGAGFDGRGGNAGRRTS